MELFIIEGGTRKGNNVSRLPRLEVLECGCNPLQSHSGLINCQLVRLSKDFCKGMKHPTEFNLFLILSSCASRQVVQHSPRFIGCKIFFSDSLPQWHNSKTT